MCSKSFGCDLDGTVRETCRHFSLLPKENILKKLIVGSREEKYTSASWAGPREFWLRPKRWKQVEEGRALWSKPGREHSEGGLGNQEMVYVGTNVTFCQKNLL